MFWNKIKEVRMKAFVLEDKIDKSKLILITEEEIATRIFNCNQSIKSGDSGYAHWPCDGESYGGIPRFRKDKNVEINHDLSQMHLAIVEA